MNSMVKSSLAIAISLPLLAGCVTPGEDDPNASTTQGAVGGALLGLTIGALTGDAELAMKSAVVGGVAGGVAGAGNDIRSNRDNIRHDSRNEAIAHTNVNAAAATAAPTETKQQNWEELNNFIGEWDVTIHNHVNTLDTISDLESTGKLNSISQAEVSVANSQGVNLTAQFSYDEAQGYQMDVTNQATQVNVNFAGEPQSQNNRYNFYPTNIQDVIYEGVNSADVRIELGMLNSQLWILESYAYLDGSEKKIQSIRFNKAS
ncbi:conserved exported hypothetical protein [Vibrio coralliirubri]|uniref:Glycine zipper domain-containing protein n=1 Tax=Vibrio coralliirubri TaxID=1516159 RepID=A0AA86WZZ7_9VIBR|nr:hypothetical protein [Vibrio coralliirubri]CDT79608.1 conserved exported hypothetical protein [Vibrio coralliirubri]